MDTKKVACVLGKGPSVIHCADFISSEDDVISINDSAKYWSGTGPIKYLFTTHPNEFWNEDLFSRAENIVMPEPEKHLLDKSCISKLITYPTRWCCGDNDSLIRMIASGGICHHHTLAGALHWLCKFGGYNHIKIIGMDGGSAYASDSDVNWRVVKLRLETSNKFLDNWKIITLTLIKILENIYGTTFELYNPSKNK